MSQPAASSPRRYGFSRRMRLGRRRDYQAVYVAGVRRSAGPLLVYARPNDLAHPRLGLSVSRRVGMAVTRNRIKRRLREAFRHMQHDLPRGYDLVISVRPHEILTLAEYQRLLSKAARALHQKWTMKLDNPTDEPA